MTRLLATTLVVATAACSSPTSSSPLPPPPAPVTTVEMSPPSLTLSVGAQGNITATPRDQNGGSLTGRTITWASSQSSIATVSNGVVTAVTPGGPIDISATSEGKSGTTQVTVTSVPVATITLDQSTLSVAQGASVTLTATPKDAAGNSLANRAMSWSSSNPAIATVFNGVVTGVALGGPVTITVTSETRSATAQVTVTPAPVATVTVSPPTGAVQVGSTTTLTATPKNAAGEDLPGRVVTWLSSNPAIATVAAGVVTGVAAGGPVTITATSETKSGTAQITVTAAPASIWIRSDEMRIGSADGHVGFSDIDIAPNGTGVSSESGKVYERTATGQWLPGGTTVPGATAINGVFADPNNQLWAVGNNGVIGRKSGGGWVTEASGYAGALNHIAILANGSGFAVGAGGTILARSALGVWTAMTSPTATTLVRVRASSPTFAMAISSGTGFVLRWDGSAWTSLPLPLANVSTNTLIVVSPTEAYVQGFSGSYLAGYNYHIMQWNGTAWSIVLQRSVPYFTTNRGAAARCGDGTLYFGTREGTVHRRQGGVWTTVANDGDNTSLGSQLVCDIDNSLILATREDLLMRYNGQWTLERWRPNLKRVAMGSATELFITSQYAVARNLGAGWVRTAIPIPRPACDGCLSINDRSAVWAVGNQAIATTEPVGRFNGTTWAWGPSGLGLGLDAAWGTSMNQVFAIGNDGIDLYNGATWAKSPSPVNYLKQIHGSGNIAVAAGPVFSPLVVKWDGSTWSSLPMPPDGVGQLHVFAADNIVNIRTTRLSRWDGTSWAFLPGGVAALGSEPEAAVAWAPDNIDAFLLGSIRHWNGSVWSTVGNYTGTVRHAARFGNQAIAIGDDGLVLRATLPSQARVMPVRKGPR